MDWIPEVVMEWFPALSTTSLLAAILWLSRKLIAERLTYAVKHEYDKKIESLKTSLRQSEESFKAELRAKESQIEALRSGALSGVTSRQAAIFERQLASIEQLWDSVISLGPARVASSWMAVVKFEAAAEEAAKNPRFREMFSMMGDIDLTSFQTNQALKTRPFISPLAWAYYAAYEAIVFHAVTRLQMLQKGIDMVEVINSENVTKLVSVALPHQIKYIEKHGPAAFHFLLDELETNILSAFKLMLKGEELDKDTITKAAKIVKASENLMESDKPVTPESIQQA